MTLSVAQQIVPFAAELAEPRLCGATIGTVMSGLLCGICLAAPSAALSATTTAGARCSGPAYSWRLRSASC
jgi:hypothetical protein